MQVYLKDGSAQTILRAATLRQKLQTKISISPSHSILIPGQPVPALTLNRQAPGTVATGVPFFFFFLSHWYDSTPKKFRLKRDSNPGSSALEADALTTRPTRLSKRFAASSLHGCRFDPPAAPICKQKRLQHCRPYPVEYVFLA